MNPMRVLYVLHTTDIYGGATKAFATLLSGQRERGVEAVVVAPDEEGITPVLRDMGVEVVVLNYRPFLYPYWRGVKDYLLAVPRMLARLWVNWRASRTLAAYLRRHPVDIVHTNTGVIGIGYRAARSAGIPHVYHVREYADLDFHMHHFPSRRAFRRRLSRSWSIFITHGIQRHFGQEDNARSLVIYDAICPPQASLPATEEPRSGADGKGYFLFAGRIEASKGLLTLLEAYNVDVPLKVAGAVFSEPYYAACRRVVEERHLPVEFLGARTDLPLLMRQALALVVCSPSEGFGLCMPEAMFQGCLVIGRNAAGTQEQYVAGERLTGGPIGFPFNTEADLARLLPYVAALPPAEADAYRQRAFTAVNTLYTTQASASAVAKLYETITAQ